MLSQNVDSVELIVDKLASRTHYHSHGSVIDSQEAIALGLMVNELSSSDALWQKIWLLRAMYAYDCGKNGYAKLFEGELVSSAVLQAR
jgi:hypothetical protein